MFRSISKYALSIAAVLALALQAGAAEWGTIKGRLVYKGTAPTPQKLKVDKDVAVCTKHHPVDESLVVGETGGLANAFVYLRAKGKVAVHPDYKASATEPVSLDNQFCRYAPHSAVKLTTQPLLLKNTDTIAHNVKGDLVKNPSFNVLVPAKSEVENTDLTKPELLPCPIGCNIHPWMRGWLLVREDPYMAVTDADGNFEIKNVPAGDHEFQLWQEKVGYLDGAKVQGKAAKKGRFTVKVKKGELDLGEIPVEAKLFEGK